VLFETLAAASQKELRRLRSDAEARGDLGVSHILVITQTDGLLLRVGEAVEGGADRLVPLPDLDLLGDALRSRGLALEVRADLRAPLPVVEAEPRHDLAQVRQ
jgi:hypothetical protein